MRGQPLGGLHLLPSGTTVFHELCEPFELKDDNEDALVLELRYLTHLTPRVSRIVIYTYMQLLIW